MFARHNNFMSYLCLALYFYKMFMLPQLKRGWFFGLYLGRCIGLNKHYNNLKFMELELKNSLKIPFGRVVKDILRGKFLVFFQAAFSAVWAERLEVCLVVEFIPAVRAYY